MTIVTKNKNSRKSEYNEARLMNYIDNVLNEFDNIPQVEKDKYKLKINNAINKLDEIRAAEITNKLILDALDNMSRESTDWTFVASRFYLIKLYKEASYNRSYDSGEKYGSLVGLLKTLGEMNIYSEDILKYYSKDEIKLAQSWIEPNKDHLFNYIGLKTLSDRYLATDHTKRTYELPQERYMIIALALMCLEPTEIRMEKVKESYWATSNHYMTVATPTWANAGKSHGQLSSCFIDTVEDSLQGIYDSNTDVANISKFGGGIGTYMGKIRSKSSSIRGFKNASSGVLPWMKQLNNTGVSVDQLGVRSGAINVTLDVWHKDIYSFLEAKLNNGDERLRTHDLFLTASIPDLFMEAVAKRTDWYLFDPHEVKEVMGYSLEDSFDEAKGKGSFRDKYDECVRNNDLSKVKVSAIDVMKKLMKAQLETGAMFIFYRDTVNRMNPNKHAGMIYSSNLCMEVTQNQTPTTVVEEQLTEDGLIIITKKAGDFVVCNLSSIHLGNVYKDDVLERLIPIQVRMLDNVIDMNKLPVKQASWTNKRYRSIGLGGFSYHHWLALKGLHWATPEAIEATDYLYEKINYLTIKASHELAVEKGSYPLFEGSDWNTGEYFELRDYGKQDDSNRLVSNEQWNELSNNVSTKGIRNAYLLCTAPNGSTAILTNGTPTIDPIYNQFYYEEKKDYKIPVVVPDLTPATNFYYNNAFSLNQHGSIKQASARQKHIDQSQSFNLYVKNDIKATELLSLLTESWEQGLKTIYYVRSTTTRIEECEYCGS
ncbi:ribonucleoside-diphosphate reductase subunit alpha [Psychrobacillus phage Perkons]|nr:ribonucleoside-diphosphate reductase subunit alpha [Psychrobacillus phage Perkons]